MSDSTFALSDVQRDFRETMRAFCEEKVAPHAAEVDRNAEYPWQSFEACKEMELPALGIPEAYGGAGADTVTQAIAVEELARVCASTSLTILISKLGMIPVMNWGSEELKRAYMPRVASGEIQASYCLSEADAGSDVAAMRSRAVRDGDDYIITGSKYWITNAGISDVYIVFAKTDPDGGSRGITCFLVEKEWGIRIAKHEEKLGMRGSPTGEVVLDEVRVPATHRIGEEGQGFTIAMHTLDRSRPTIGAQAVGIGAGRHRLRRRLHEAAPSFRRPDRRLAGSAFHAGGHGDAQRGRPCARLPGLRHGRSRPLRRAHPVRGDGQGLRFRCRHGDHHRRSAAAGRLRLQQGVPSRALSARRQGDADLRGDEPGTKSRHRPGAARNV